MKPQPERQSQNDGTGSHHGSIPRTKVYSLYMITRSVTLAAAIAASIQCFTVGFLAPYLPREVCRPMARASRTFALPASRRLHVSNADGTVRIASSPGDTVSVVADIRAYVPSREMHEAAQAYIETLLADELDGDTLTLRTEPGQRPDAIDLRVDYAIRMPEGTDVVVEGINGNVDISEGAGRVTVLGSNTDVHIGRPLGPVEVATTNGRIRLYDAPADASLVTVNGSIYVHMLGGSLKASTTNGHIVAHLLSDQVEACDLNATNGGVTLAMLDDCAATVNASTLRGVIRSDFPIAGDECSVRRRSLQGAIGGGGTALSLHSLNGNIWLARNSS